MTASPVSCKINRMSQKYNNATESKSIKFNLRDSSDKRLNISPDEIPTLTPKEVIAPFMEGDDSPYYKIQAIEFPLKANGYTYTESFFRSFLAKLNTRYIPGSRAGHVGGWGERPPTDLMLVGGRIDSTGIGKGVVYFKNYIPKEGQSGDNEFFIKENKANMVDYSLVTYSRDERKENPDGTTEWLVIESIFGERNDAVEYGKGSMKQKTNSQEESPQNGGEKNNRSEKQVEKKELFETLRVMKENADVSLPEIAAAIGLQSLVVTDEHRNAVSVVGGIKALIGDADPVAFIKANMEEKKANAAKVRDAELTTVCGPAVFAETGKKNELRSYAEIYFGDKEITAEKVNAFKADEIAQKLAGERADWSSKANTFGAVDTSGKDAKPAIGGAVKL